MLNARNRSFAALAAVAGIAVSAIAAIRFILDWSHGELDWWNGFAGRELYLAAGRGYGKGFVVGFFLAFSLVVLAIAVSSWWESRRARRRRERASRAAGAVAANADA
jgi:uncharacterized membrane protein